VSFDVLGRDLYFLVAFGLGDSRFSGAGGRVHAGFCNGGLAGGWVLGAVGLGGGGNKIQNELFVVEGG